MSWNDLTERQKDLDRAIERCGIKIDDSTTCLSKVMRAIGANPTEASFVKARINLRLKTQMALERADDLISFQFPDVDVNAMSMEQMNQFIKEHDVKCPVCGKSDFTDVRQFNMMFKTHIGVTEDSKSVVYLRPETAQGVFVNFKNVQRTTRKKLPLGIANVGKSFRNEITPGNFIFRTREFTQMELEFFCKPGTDLEWFKYWKDFSISFVESLGIKAENLRFRDHEPEELAFYSKATTDIEYKLNIFHIVLNQA